MLSFLLPTVTVFATVQLCTHVRMRRHLRLNVLLGDVTLCAMNQTKFQQIQQVGPYI